MVIGEMIDVGGAAARDQLGYEKRKQQHPAVLAT